jgi:hypothetical protein
MTEPGYLSESVSCTAKPFQHLLATRNVTIWMLALRYSGYIFFIFNSPGISDYILELLVEE